MNFFGSNGARLSLGLGGQEPPRFRLNRSLLSLICSLHKSPCLEPAPADRSLNRAPKTSLAFGQQTLRGPKDCTAEKAKTEKGGSQPRKTLAESRSRFGSAPLRWFKLTAGINGILPASGGPLPFIPLLA